MNYKEAYIKETISRIFLGPFVQHSDFIENVKILLKLSRYSHLVLSIKNFWSFQVYANFCSIQWFYDLYLLARNTGNNWKRCNQVVELFSSLICWSNRNESNFFENTARQSFKNWGDGAEVRAILKLMLLAKKMLVRSR